MYTIRVSGEQGNRDWQRTAKTLIGAKRIATREACMGISYAVCYDGNVIATLEAWQQLNRWGHEWVNNNE